MGPEIKRHVAFANSGKGAKGDERWVNYVLKVKKWRITVLSAGSLRDAFTRAA